MCIRSYKSTLNSSASGLRDSLVQSILEKHEFLVLVQLDLGGIPSSGQIISELRRTSQAAESCQNQENYSCLLVSSSKVEN